MGEVLEASADFDEFVGRNVAVLSKQNRFCRCLFDALI